MVAMLLGSEIFPVCAHAQKKVVIGMRNRIHHVRLQGQGRR